MRLVTESETAAVCIRSESVELDRLLVYRRRREGDDEWRSGGARGDETTTTEASEHQTANVSVRSWTILWLMVFCVAYRFPPRRGSGGSLCAGLPGAG